MTDKQSAEPSKEALEFAALWHKNALRDNLHEERLARAVQNLLNTEIAKARLEGVQLGLDRARRAIRAEFKPTKGTYHPLEIIIMYRDEELNAALEQAAGKKVRNQNENNR